MNDPKKDIDISVIIVSYNVRYYLEQCLSSVYAAASSINIEVFVVDNASSDGTIAYIRKKFPSSAYPTLHLMANAHNAGFGRANNQAAHRATGKYVLFLNPDTLLTEHTLRDSLDFAERHPDMGGLGTMMLHTNGSFAYESRRGLPTPWTAFFKMSGMAALFPRHKTFGRYYMRYLDKEQPSEIEIISGAYMMVRKQVLEECGLFDETFFMYGEDIDLSYRILKSGHSNYYIPSPILHYKGESTQKSSYRYVHVFYGAMLIFFHKHFRHYRIGLSLLIKTAILIRALVALAAQQMQNLKNFLFPERRHIEGRQLYIGRHANEVKRLAEQWGMDITYMEADEHSMPLPRIPDMAEGGQFIHVIYDTADFSRAYILEAFKTSGHKAAIGTYSPHTGLIITGSGIFEPFTNEEEA